MPMTRDERDALLVRYRDGAAEFAAAVADVTEPELDAHPIEGEWSIREIAHHLADGELTSAVRLRRLIAEDDAAILGYDERSFTDRLHATERPIASSVEAATAARASTLSILECLTDDEWKRTGTHSESGAYGVERWLEIYADHPWDHADQARRVLAAIRGGAG
jgi:DinB superfamily